LYYPPICACVSPFFSKYSDKHFVCDSHLCAWCTLSPSQTNWLGHCNNICCSVNYEAPLYE
jgi:hypothetical protein